MLTRGGNIRQWKLRAAAALIIAVAASAPCFGSTDSHQAHALKITVLVTNLAGDAHEGDGEWGYSALVDIDGHKFCTTPALPPIWS